MGRCGVQALPALFIQQAPRQRFYLTATLIFEPKMQMQKTKVVDEGFVRK
jgi:hypothetical protein